MINREFVLSHILLSMLVFTATYAIAGPNEVTVSEPTLCYSLDGRVCSEVTATGHSKGNHELNCMVIQPWIDTADPPVNGYPVIVWANGWGWNDNAGETTTLGYKPGLIEWALDGPYVVVAANQWSVQESDILQCLEWVLDEYESVIDDTKLGLSGHSQGGGAVIKAGDGGGNQRAITATIPMNPYGPAWVRSGNQNGPMLILAGSEDTTTPTSSFDKVWEAVQLNDHGGLHAELQGGTHNDDAWGPAGANPEDYNFGCYQPVTELWWKYQFTGDENIWGMLVDELENPTDPACGDWVWEPVPPF